VVARTGSENERLKHLEFIQATITRLGNNSFLIRGWAVTVTGALLVVSVQAKESSIAALAFLIGIGFWFLDASYLRRERMFRRLYDDVALLNPSHVPTFSMNVQPYLSTVSWKGALFSSSVLMIHISIVVTDIAIAIVLAL
jgi:hypothetical protein